MFQVGDKVCIPKTKSTGVPIEDCDVIARAKVNKRDYLYIVSLKGGTRYVINVPEAFEQGVVSGNHYLKQDLELFIPENYYIGGIEDV